MTYNQFILDETGDSLSNEQRGFLNTSVAAATGMKRLIDNFLDVSVIESGHLRLERSKTVISAIFTGVLPIVGIAAKRKNVELFTDTPEENLLVNVDVARIQQVLVNLLSNAIEHSKAGQRVWLTARSKDTAIEFSVRDEGPGITPGDQKRLFAPFACAGTRKTAGERSIGLGLSIAHTPGKFQ